MVFNDGRQPASTGLRRMDHEPTERVMHAIERLWPYRVGLVVVAAIGLLGLNGVYVYHLIVHQEVVSGAFDNPVSVVFMAEALVMVIFGAWLIRSLGLERPGWLAFVVLSFVGTLAFSVPTFLLLHLRRSRREEERSVASRHPTTSGKT